MDNEAFFKQAVASEKAGQVDLAATLYERILDNIPTHPGTLYNLATLNAKRNDFHTAIQLFERMLAVEPDFAQAYYNVAICYMKISDVVRAKEYLKTAVLLVPEYEDAQHLLGGILLATGEFSQAHAHFEAVLAVNTEHASAHCHLGMVCVHLDRMEDAAFHLKRAITLDSSLVEAHYHLGLVALQRGQLDKAAEHFESTIGRDSKHFSAYYNLALIKKTQGQLNLAHFYIEKAYGISPEHPFVAYLYGMIDPSQAPSVTPPGFVESLFNEYAPYYDQHLTKTLHSDLPQQCFALFKKVHPEKVIKTMDVGCGTGLAGELFRSHTQLLVGVDLSEKMLDKARMKHVYDALYQEDMVVALRRSEHTVDLVVCCDALGYVGDLDPFFEGLTCALKPNGYALLTCEAGDKPFALSLDGRYTHAAQYLRACAEKYGFDVLAFEVTTLREQHEQPVDGYIMLVCIRCVI